MVDLSWAGKALDWLKERSDHLITVLLGLTILTGILSFAPPGLISALHLQPFMASNGAWVGLVFLALLCGLVGRGCLGGYEWTSKKLKTKAWIEALLKLAPAERGLLRLFVKAQTKTLLLSPMGSINGLVGQGFVIRSAPMGQQNRWAFTVEPWVWQYITAHPEFFDHAADPEDAHWQPY